MNKKTLLLGAALSVAMSGCAINMKVPVMATAKGSASKTGTGECYVALGIYWGDCSISSAKEKAGINEVTSIDKELTGIDMIAGKSTIIVKGN